MSHTAENFAELLVKDAQEESGNQTESTDAQIERRAAYIKNQLDNMTEEQLTRFEFFVRSHFSRKHIKSILAEALGSSSDSVSDDVAIVVGSLTKLFVGELMESAIDAWNEGLEESDSPFSNDNTERTGVQVVHIEEAYRRMQMESKIGQPADNIFQFDGKTTKCSDYCDIFDS